jgi:transcriptional regulator with XRE-family HTH domain
MKLWDRTTSLGSVMEPNSRRRSPLKSSRIGSAIDIHIGYRIRQRRLLLGMSQNGLGRAVGLSFQQIQKYEHGASGIGASRLHDLSRALNVPITFFYAGIVNTLDGLPKDTQSKNKENEARMLADIDGHVVTRDVLELVRVYHKILDLRLRRRVLELAKIIAKL